ncbi:phosphoribosyl-AMP cyclohydrolase [Polynucleobacter sp. IMCC30063]|uniref:phosphoribosyl-AMP cyclohydrolase n=1 Tax=unclassified Polynucleobacter TaxID=2640945 RepID=UPI001F2E864C|nr:MULTISPECIES: phosphoribosyl-AMP cyclohydrolase [unclassified Polynucleobacter]MCE7504988.1 phosphoribosyl-AMP cyclohydrolase [Polynucleobacter sp. IMCC30063]MCE7526221.1 phosphoribosyl-AMP cyclohydrolase [Polynucleobacter sp. IMCC 30228]MCE7528526.1 phosphoribosyl-AMP cyclohydrolase [Polynucleobacter sp. IMCC 29146]
MTSFIPTPTLQSGPWLEQIQWNQQGLVPVIAQEVGSGDVLMMAWMNREALLASLRLGQAVYWSRSRNQLWHKGAESGHTQTIEAIGLDCDGDTLLLQVIQKDRIACHTGAHSCFFQVWDAASASWLNDGIKLANDSGK